MLDEDITYDDTVQSIPFKDVRNGGDVDQHQVQVNEIDTSEHYFDLGPSKVNKYLDQGPKDEKQNMDLDPKGLDPYFDNGLVEVNPYFEVGLKRAHP